VPYVRSTYFPYRLQRTVRGTLVLAEHENEDGTKEFQGEIEIDSPLPPGKEEYYPSYTFDDLNCKFKAPLMVDKNCDDYYESEECDDKWFLPFESKKETILEQRERFVEEGDEEEEARVDDEDLFVDDESEDEELDFEGQIYVVSKRVALPWIPREFTCYSENYGVDELKWFDSLEEAQTIANDPLYQRSFVRSQAFTHTEQMYSIYFC